ncbi:leucine-rich repeat-containing protein 73-like [Acanthaster planci]|uniref:Leucine-rich repeat-containing protein 73-like n=1 Tax=Acanthaster planci TaxID=133434 RepID=A0A8B7YBL2_ACAPL|nr:leucine-rich repeat-containing protein 73-like [Acanthaster planci]
MLLGTVQLSGENISSADARDICESLQQNSIKLLSLRSCRMADRHYRRMMEAVAECRSISQLNLNLGLVCSRERVRLLASALTTNKSLTGLYLHGSPLGDDGLALLIDSLSLHPGITSLDLGDCRLGDRGIQMLCRLLPTRGARSGLKELTLSANPAVTPAGWAYLAVAISSDSCLRVLNLDYNRLGDTGVCMLAVSAASCKTLEVMDLESVGASDQGARVLLTLLSGFSRTLTDVVVKDNNINTDIERELAQRLGQVHVSADSSSSDSGQSGDEALPPASGSGKKRPRRGGTDSTRRAVSMGSPRDEQLRSVERTAMRLLKRTKSSEGALLRKRRTLKRGDHLSESDLDSSEEEISLYMSNMDIGRTEKSSHAETAHKSASLLTIQSNVVTSSPQQERLEQNLAIG